MYLTLLRRALVVAATLVSVTVLAAPRAFVATYEVQRNGSLLGEATIQLDAQPDGRWRMRTITEGTAGMAALAKVRIEESSTLRFSNDQWATDEYRYQQRAAFSNRERSVRVDRQRGTVTLQNRDNSATLPLEPNLLDRQAVTLALMQQVSTGEGREWTFRVADRNRIDSQRWRTTAQVRLRTALGRIHAVRIERVRDSADGKSTRVWLGRDQGWVPLRIQQVDGAETVEMRLRSLR